MKLIYDIAVIGAGASGLMFASLLKNKNSIVIDSNSKIGEKIRVSGGGKCNITNKYVSFDKYLGEKEFIKHVLKKFTNHDLLKFLNKNGVKPKLIEKIVKGTYFCNSSSDLISMYSKLIKKESLSLNTKVKSVSYDGKFIIKTSKGVIEAKKLVVASGGLSFPGLGASTIAFDIAKHFGHEVNTTTPSLVGFTVQKDQFWFKKLSGLSFNVTAKVGTKTFKGGFLFTHKGCSGPVILNASLYWNKGHLIIDFLPKRDISQLQKSNKLISSAIPLPKRFMGEFLKSIDVTDKPINKLNEDELEKLKSIKKYSCSPAGNFGYTKAEVTRGGISLDEINMKTMESARQKGLYFLGEALDVTGELGGYNLQWAFSSAFVCAENI
jgi:predicted Rossmann fold flavoprotein